VVKSRNFSRAILYRNKPRLGPFRFSPEQVKDLDSVIGSLEVVLPARAANLQAWGYRAIAQMQLRLGRYEKCLAALEKSASQQTTPEPYNLFIKAICLHRLGQADTARAAFDQAGSLMAPLLKETIEEPERLLRPWDLYQQVVMCRETRALLGVE
jgi:tetratricopeptide (TPR) repeat protein